MMKKLILLFSLLLTASLSSQTLIRYDNIENYNWTGSGWAVGFGSASGYYTNASVSSNSSAALIGSGNGSSPIEEGYYLLPNVTGLSSSNSYEFKFRLGAYRFSNSTASTSGNDASDYVTVQMSTDGGSTYTQEIRVTGFSNAIWNYNSASIYKISNGTLTTYSPTTGGNRTSTGDGYSSIILSLPYGITQCAFRIYCRSNSAGEEWWLDNIELWNVTPTPLPVELTYFEGNEEEGFNLLKWQTASESNSSHFIVEKSILGDFSEKIIVGSVLSSSYSQELIDYSLNDIKVDKVINYYRLTQYDRDGNYKVYPIVSIDNRIKREIDKILDLTGREIENSYEGWVIIFYKDGTSEKTYQY
jgi:hypothetical protein